MSEIKTIISIDPGMKGAMVIAECDNELFFIKDIINFKGTHEEIMKTVHKKLLDFLNSHPFIEEVTSFGQGSKSAFTFGGIYHGLQGVCSITLENQVDRISPKKWQKGLNAPSFKHLETKSKQKTAHKRWLFDKAKELLPRVKGITLQNADAVLMAYQIWKENLI